MLDLLMYKLGPFLLSFSCSDIDELALKWKDIAKRYLGKGVKEPSLEQLLMQGYTLLDMHPLLKKDKLKKRKNTLDNIIRDGKHCYYASGARYFVSEDEGTRIKAIRHMGLIQRYLAWRSLLIRFTFLNWWFAGT